MKQHFLKKKTINDNSDDGIPVGALAGVGGHGRAQHCPFRYFGFVESMRDSSTSWAVLGIYDTILLELNDINGPRIYNIYNAKTIMVGGNGCWGRNEE